MVSGGSGDGKVRSYVDSYDRIFASMASLSDWVIVHKQPISPANTINCRVHNKFVCTHIMHYCLGLLYCSAHTVLESYILCRPSGTLIGKRCICPGLTMRHFICYILTVASLLWYNGRLLLFYNVAILLYFLLSYNFHVNSLSPLSNSWVPTVSSPLAKIIFMMAKDAD
ncbi:hypothetical protein XELAEV_18026854mg [Xenopus laevis]|uniref:Uncharacterized protein n=1 Tax=Xenopus laevis TaxID=8355 RepID=A0A974CX00_XENLA|nr:hypothetical protein XELAEV_18026854mg [Xenopus laevis]